MGEDEWGNTLEWSIDPAALNGRHVRAQADAFIARLQRRHAVSSIAIVAVLIEVTLDRAA